MKKKVLALVVLAAMLVSILPFAAFAAANSYYSAVKVNEDTAAADGLIAKDPKNPTEEELDDSEYLEFEVTLRDNQYQNAGGTLYIATNRPTVDIIYVEEVGIVDQSATDAAKATVPTEGVVTVRIYSGVPGETKVGFGVNTTDGKALANYVQGRDNASATDAAAIDQKLFTATFTSADIAKLVVTADPYDAIWDDKDKDNVMDADELTTKVIDYPLANNTQKYTLTAKVTASNGAPVSGEEVTFTVNKTGARLSETKVTTDAYGEAEVKLYATKPGTYKVTAEVDDKEFELDRLTFKSASVDSVQMESDNNQKIALEEKATFKYSFYDANGNQFELNADPVLDDGVVQAGDLEDTELTLVTAPSGAKLDLENNNHFTLTRDNDNETLKLTIKEGYLDKEGDYAIKLTLANGKSVTYNFNVKEQGEITQLIFSYKTTSMPAVEGARNYVDDLKLADAEGYTKDAELDDVKFSTNNTKLAKVYDADVKVDADNDKVYDETKGDYTIAKGTMELLADPSTGTVVITAVHDDEDLVASATIQVVNAPSTVQTSSSKVVAAGSEATVDIQLVDVDGKPVSAAFPGDVDESRVVIVSKPAGAIVDTDFDSDFNSDIENKGSSSFEITSNMEGTIGYQVVVAVENIQTTGANTYYTGYGEITFGEASEVNLGENIIFIVGAGSYIVDGVPVAATSTSFIENGRTFLGIRDMAYSMGIVGDENVKWDNATQTATITKDGITVEVTVGANTIKVTKDGVTTETAIDAPAQNRDGRVYLPFRAVFQAFGYEVEYANGVITCK